MSSGVPISHQRQVLWILSLKDQRRGGEKGTGGRFKACKNQRPTWSHTLLQTVRLSVFLNKGHRSPSEVPAFRQIFDPLPDIKPSCARAVWLSLLSCLDLLHLEKLNHQFSAHTSDHAFPQSCGKDKGVSPRAGKKFCLKANVRGVGWGWGWGWG